MSAIHEGIWDLVPADRLLVETRRWANRLRFAVLLLFFRARGRFPRGGRGGRAAAGWRAEGARLVLMGLDDSFLLSGAADLLADAGRT